LIVVPVWSSQDFVDTLSSVFYGGFEFFRAYASLMTVASRAIVERLDIFGSVALREISVLIDPLLDAFLLQAPEERLGDSIVPAAAPSTPAGLESICSAEASPIDTAVLNPDRNGSPFRVAVFA
jgi:hypothetical protein